MYLVGLRSTSVRAEQRFPEPLAPLSLVEYVAVWALKLPALHTDVLKTHEFQSFSAKLLEFNKWHPPNHLLPCLNTMADTLYVSVCGQVIAVNFFSVSVNDLNSIYISCAAPA